MTTKLYANLVPGVRVLYRTPRGVQEGLGEIARVLRTGRGYWFEIKDVHTGAVVRVRAAALEVLP